MHRRKFLTGLPAVWLAAPAEASIADNTSTIDDLIADLTSKMAEKHGGEWKSTVDRQNKFVMICRH